MMENPSHIPRVGLPGMDRIPFGTHACHFYSNRDELIRTLVPYFIEGLSGNERCFWVTAPPLPARDAYIAIRKQGVDDAIQDGALVVLNFDQWYTSSAGLKGRHIVDLWLKEEERALAEGYNGLRIAGNTSFLKPGDWSAFLEYDRSVTTGFKNRRIVALCSYMSAHCNEQQRSEVLHAHHRALQGSDTDRKRVEPPALPQHGTSGTDQPISQPAEGAGSAISSAGKVRLLIAEDHAVLRYTLRSILSRYPDLDIVGEAANGEEAVVRAQELQPTIVLMDISMPRLDGITATRRIRAASSRIAVVGLSVDTEGHSVQSMLNAGAVAVVPKERAAEDLYSAIHRAIAFPQ